MRIDSETGLPALPDDMFWRIKNRDFHFKYSVYELLLVRNLSVYKHLSAKYWMGLIPISKATTDTENIESILVTKKLYSSRMVDIDKELPEGYKIVDTYYFKKGRVEHLLLKAEEPSSELFYSAAVEAWDEYMKGQHLWGLEEDARLDREREAKKYTGDYPPRKLGKQ